MQPPGGSNGPGGPNGPNGPGMANGPNGQGAPNGAGMAGGAGAPGGNNQSPFSGGKGEGAEAVAQKFYDKLMAGEANGVVELFSSKAAGKAKAFRDGKATESMIEEMKKAFTGMKLSSTKQLQGTHIVLLEENGAGGNQGSSSGYGRSQGERSQKKVGKKVQFKIVSEGGSLVIQDIQIRDH